MQSSDNIERAINFVWAEIGKELKQLDKERLLALAQLHPEKHLSIRYNQELLELLDKIFSNDDINLDKETIKKIIKMNNADNIFREIGKTLRKSQDLLSTGATVIGQQEKQTLPLRTVYKDD